jgi:preflagellin peptidase FlaK
VGHHLLLVPIAFIAVYTVRDDLRHGRIFNRRVLQGLGMGVAAYLLLLGAEHVPVPSWCCSAPPAGGELHWGLVAIQNLGLGLGVGILLWLLGVWAAGDAKLFAVYAFLLPPAVYTRSYLDMFPAFPLLINVFAFAFLFLILDLVRTGIPSVLSVLRDGKKRAETLKEAPGWLLKLAPALLLFIALFAGLRTLRQVSREELETFLHVSDFTLFLILFAVFRPLMRLVMNRIGAVVFTVLSVAALGYLIWLHGLSEVPTFLKPSAMAVVLLVFSRAYPGLAQTTVKGRVGDLGPGSILATETLQILKEKERKELLEREEAPDPEEEKVRFGRPTAEGLTEEQVQYLRERWVDDEPLLLARTIPFSPFLALGAALTYALGGPVTTFLHLTT